MLRFNSAKNRRRSDSVNPLRTLHASHEYDPRARWVSPNGYSGCVGQADRPSPTRSVAPQDTSRHSPPLLQDQQLQCFDYDPFLPEQEARFGMRYHALMTAPWGRSRHLPAILLFASASCSDDPTKSNVTVESLASWTRTTLKVDPVNPIGSYYPPGSMIYREEDGSILLLAAVSDCFTGTLTLDFEESNISATSTEKNNKEVKLTLSVKELEQVLPASLSVRTGRNEQAELTMNNVRIEEVAKAAFQMRMRSPEFSPVCLEQIAAGALVVRRSASATDFDVEVSETSGEAVELSARIPESSAEVALIAADEHGQTDTLRASEPVTLGVLTFVGTELVEARSELPEVAAAVLPTLDDQALEDETTPPTIEEPTPEQSTNGEDWLACHRDCSSIACVSMCNDTWLDCGSDCGSNQDCREACWADNLECKGLCSTTADACGAQCNEEYL